jgi:maltoporin
LLAAAALGTLSTAASAVDWGGYVRVGPGQKQASGDGQRCFNGAGIAAPGHGGIGRLGNECNTYGEFGLSQVMDAGGVKYKGLLMTNFFNPGSDIGDGVTTTKVNQIYVEGKGYDIAPNQTFWIGRRFYHRADVHFDDSFYVNMTGMGAGVDEIPVGLGELSLAVFRTDDSVAGVSNPITRFNIDWEKAQVNPGGTLRITGVGTKAKGTGGENGSGVSVQHIQVLQGGPSATSVPTLANTAWLQFAKGSAALNMGSGNATDGSDVKQWRIADAITLARGAITGQALIAYGRIKSNATGTLKDFSVAGRVAYALTNNFKLQGELGHDRFTPDVGEKQNVSKFTIAPTLTVGSDFYARPELRFYASHFSFNDAYRIANGQTKKSKSAVGFQAEVWF